MKIGQKVYIPELDIYGEVVEVSDKVRGLITKIKVAGKDGYEFKEVANLTVEAVIVLRDIVASDVFRAFGAWVSKLFRKNRT
jgi:hypothetical protein